MLSLFGYILHNVLMLFLLAKKTAPKTVYFFKILVVYKLILSTHRSNFISRNFDKYQPFNSFLHSTHNISKALEIFNKGSVVDFTIDEILTELSNKSEMHTVASVYRQTGNFSFTP